MKVLLISSYIFGYMDFAVEEMKRQGHEVEVLYYEDAPLKFEYNNIFHKISAGIGKLFGENAKKKAREEALKKRFRGKSFDYTLIIHGQYLNQETHVFLKSISKKYVTYFFDSLTKMPEQRKLAHYFDEVFSYEPEDCKSESYTFIPNFIATDKLRSDSHKHQIFNISAYDHRWNKLNRLAEYLHQHKIDFKFIIFSKKRKSFKLFSVTTAKLPISEIEDYIRDCKIMVDIQRKDQKGLSFRPFEALGNHKKLITNNPEIKKYDFYNENNILVINPEDIHIPKEFLASNYQEVPADIYKKYTVETWVKTILS